MIHYNLDCDFKIAEPLYADAPFRYTYYAKSEKTVVAEYDGTDYHGCYPMGDMLIVPINARSLGLGEVKVRREYYLTDKDFTDGICNRVTGNVPLGIEIWRGETDGMETHEVKVVPAYQKGDPFTFDDMTDAQKQDIANRVPTKEPEREQAEVKRERNEELREANEAIREENETSRQDAEVIREENEKRREETYQQKVDRDDNAPKLTAGFANNLVGRGDVTKEEISFRPSGGDTSIEDGTARIERVKGSTLVWNQLASNNKDIPFSRTLSGYATVSIGNLQVNKVYAGHKYYILASVSYSSEFSVDRFYFAEMQELVFINNTPVILTAKTTYNNAMTLRFYITKEEASGNSVEGTASLLFVDLTQMFGEGNEPTTIEEFHARKPLNIDEYAYNEGELISNNVEELKSVGFNAWDEEWEAGRFNPANGVIISDKRIYSTNYIRVIQGKTYNINVGSIIIFYDENKKYVTSHVGEGEFTIPSGCVYIRFSTSNDGYGNIYNHDICIHLVHTGYRNGEYEPYKEFRRSIPIKDIKDNDGNQLFPLGLLSAGSVYDEITATKAIKRVGVVDMGSLSYTLNAANGYYYSDGFMQAKFTDLLNNLACSHYITKNWGGAGGFTLNYAGDRKTCVAIWKNNTTGLSRVNILDDSVTDATELMAMLKEKDVMLYYELAEPIEVDLPEPLNLVYEVSDFGTEEVLSSGPTAPMKADIVYLFNAVDRIRDNSRHTAEADKKLLDYESRIAALEAIVASLTSSES